nr:Ty3/gypsy retrotransposon protein [Ipomoea batatas]
MAYEGVQTRHRSLEEQVQQLRENHQQTTEELRQALAAQNQALTEAITNAITDLLVRITQLNTLLASSSTPPPPSPQPPHPGSYNPYQPVGVQHPRSLHCDMSSFDGTNPLDWLFQAEKYFNFWDITEEQRIDIASFYMRAFTIALEQRFGPSTYVNHRATPFKLTQRTTVAAYQSEFETLSNRVTNLPPEALLDCFISELKSSI